MNLITIIIPMYNEEYNIQKCVTNLRNQTNQNFNVIFIDDGSTDFTIATLEYELQNRIKFEYNILKQSNKGASEARLVGIMHSFTKYIMIYDCDDQISSDYIDVFYKNYYRYQDPDIVIPNVSVQDKTGIWKDFKFYTESRKLKPIECVKYSLNGWKVPGWFTIKKDIILKSYSIYNEYNPRNRNYINNDEVITRLNFLNSQHIVRSDAIYYYCYNKSSTTKKFNQNSYLQLKNNLIMDSLFAKNSYLNKDIKLELFSQTWGKYKALQHYASEISNTENWHEILKESVNYINYFDLLPHLSLRQKIQLSILKLKYAF